MNVEQHNPPPEIARAAAQLEAAAAFLKSNYLEAVIEQAVKQATQRAQSEHLDMGDAAAYLGTSDSTINRLVGLEKLKAYYVGQCPKFVKAELREALLTGKLDLRPKK